MYKSKPKTLFIGKKIHYLPSCQSTNDEAAVLLRQGEGLEGTVVITDHQMAGRGQRGNRWLAKPGENFTLSLILHPHFLTPGEQFRLNIAVSLGVYDFLSPYLGNFLKIKWPNDIYVKNQKLGGILIENTVQGSRVESSIVGIGLNINQLDFEEGRATSLGLETKKEYLLEELLPDLLASVEKNYLLLRNRKYDLLKTRYLQHVFRYQEPHLFQRRGEEVEGVIVGVAETGHLAVQINNKLEYFDFKEISYVF
ncbi:biotin--[acetyl-CoA-carboxylase] ligase [Runella sp.]|uniref:biotin--[acetyl-CoA-carboxylase] ligase n=1 Tax=Runella sp. TaxID=1960881 RepID=UPI003D10F7E9